MLRVEAQTHASAGREDRERITGKVRKSGSGTDCWCHKARFSAKLKSRPPPWIFLGLINEKEKEKQREWLSKSFRNCAIWYK